MMQKIYTMMVTSQIILGLKPPFSVKPVQRVQQVHSISVGTAGTVDTVGTTCTAGTPGTTRYNLYNQYSLLRGHDFLNTYFIHQHITPVLMTLKTRTKHQNILGCTKL